MTIPVTKGYTEIVKIAEAGLLGDQQKVMKYMEKFLIKYPESDLCFAFNHLLNGDESPVGFGDITEG